MTRLPVYSLLFFCVVSVTFSLLALGTSQVSAQATCHLLTSASPVPNGFSAPFNVLSSAKELLISGTCGSSSIAVTVGVGSATQYVYEQSYFWTGSAWQPTPLQGSNKTGAWYIGAANATLPRTTAQLQAQTFFVAYICSWTGSVWKCGCRDEACAVPNWQLQAYQLSGSNTTGQTTSQTTGQTTGQSTGQTTGSTGGGNTNIVLHAMQGNIEELVTGLDTVWDIAFLPDGTLLVAERPGNVTHIDTNGAKTRSAISGVSESGESGLYGMTLHPNFAQNKYVYLFYYVSGQGRVARFVFENKTLKNPVVLIQGLPGGSRHSGGALRFGPDDKLYISVGELANKELAQDQTKLHGKVIRVNEDGSVPSDNPFNNSVWALGLRNPQGLVWDSAGRLWSTDHGPSGDDGPQGYDEINLIEKGKNYGWPTVCCGNTSPSTMEAPKAISGTGNATWAPSGITWIQGKIYFSGLRGQALYSATTNGTSLGTLQTHFKNTYGRIRAVVRGPDGMLYFGTSNGDQVGRQNGTPDKIIRVNPSSI